MDSSCISFEMEGFVKKDDFNKLNESFVQLVTQMKELKQNLNNPKED